MSTYLIIGGMLLLFLVGFFSKSTNKDDLDGDGIPWYLDDHIGG